MEERVDSKNERRRKMSDAATRIERDDMQERRWPRQNAFAAATAAAMLILVGGCNDFQADPTTILVDTGDADVTPDGSDSDADTGDADVTPDASDSDACTDNGCGGCVSLPTIGAPCGPCDLDSLVCDGADAVRCDGETTCDSVCGDGAVTGSEECDGEVGRTSCATGSCAADCRCVPVPTPPSGWAYIPPGTFTMGSPFGEVGYRGEEAQHSVTLTRGFLLQTTEVTQAAWISAGGSSSTFWFASSPDTHPAEQMDWYAALAYANALTSSPLTDCYTFLPSGCANDWQDGDTDNDGSGCTSATWNPVCTGYRLPTEAEWEYAARAGTTTATYRGNLESPYDCDPQPNLEPIAWYCENAGSETHPVGTLTSNGWGFYDMLGNVWEWVWDGYSSTLPAATDPTGIDGASTRVSRGGSWRNSAGNCRAANRGRLVPSNRRSILGFRLSMSVR